MALVTSFLNLDNVGSEDGLTKATGWKTMLTWATNEATNLVTDGDTHKVLISGSGADVLIATGIDFAALGWTTGASNNILMTNDVADRHAGIFDSGKYHLKAQNTTNNFIAISTIGEFVDIEHLQFVLDVSTNFNANSTLIRRNDTGSATFTNANIFKNISSSTNSNLVGLTHGSATGQTFEDSNNVYIDFDNSGTFTFGLGVEGDFTDVESYNETFIGCKVGVASNDLHLIKNCIFQGCTTDISSTNGIDSNSDFNLTDSATAFPTGSNNVNSATLTFEDAASDDFHLASGDTAAIGAGVGPSTDSNVPLVDVDGDVRSGTTTDIGYDLRVAGPNISDVNTTNIITNGSNITTNGSALDTTTLLTTTNGTVSDTQSLSNQTEPAIGPNALVHTNVPFTDANQIVKVRATDGSNPNEIVVTKNVASGRSLVTGVFVDNTDDSLFGLLSVGTASDDDQLDVPTLTDNGKTVTYNADGTFFITAPTFPDQLSAVRYWNQTTWGAAQNVSITESGAVVTNGLTGPLTSSLTGPLTSGLTSGAAIQRIFITLDPVLNGFYELANSWTASGDFEIEFQFSTTDSSAVKRILGGPTNNQDEIICFMLANGIVTFIVRTGVVESPVLFTVAAYNDGKLHTGKIGFSGTTMSLQVDDATPVTGTHTRDGNETVSLIGNRANNADFFDGVIANVKFTDLVTSNNTFTFALDEVTANTETAAEGGNSVTYTNIPTGAPDRELFTLVGDEWLEGEVLTNGDFATDTDWTKGTGWTISGGKASSDGTQAGDSDLTQTSVISGLRYQTVYTSESVSAGNSTILVGTTEGTDRPAAGEFTENITAAGTLAGIRADVNFVGDITNISIKRILEAP